VAGACCYSMAMGLIGLIGPIGPIKSRKRLRGRIPVEPLVEFSSP
jgi:hypothetical protein